MGKKDLNLKATGVVSSEQEDIAILTEPNGSQEMTGHAEQHSALTRIQKDNVGKFDSLSDRIQTNMNDLSNLEETIANAEFEVILGAGTFDYEGTMSEPDRGSFTSDTYYLYEDNTFNVSEKPLYGNNFGWKDTQIGDTLYVTGTDGVSQFEVVAFSINKQAWSKTYFTIQAKWISGSGALPMNAPQTLGVKSTRHSLEDAFASEYHLHVKDDVIDDGNGIEGNDAFSPIKESIEKLELDVNINKGNIHDISEYLGGTYFEVSLGIEPWTFTMLLPPPSEMFTSIGNAFDIHNNRYQIHKNALGSASDLLDDARPGDKISFINPDSPGSNWGQYEIVSIVLDGDIWDITCDFIKGSGRLSSGANYDVQVIHVTKEFDEGLQHPFVEVISDSIENANNFDEFKKAFLARISTEVVDEDE